MLFWMEDLKNRSQIAERREYTQETEEFDKQESLLVYFHSDFVRQDCNFMPFLLCFRHHFSQARLTFLSFSVQLLLYPIEVSFGLKFDYKEDSIILLEMAAQTMRVQIQLIQLTLQAYLNSLEPSHLQKQYKLRFPLHPLLPLPIPFIKSCLLLLFRLKYPLLLDYDASTHPLSLYDCQVKILYQQLLSHRRLSNFNFDYLLILTVYLFRSFFSSTFQEVFLTKQDESQLHCLLLKSIIGLHPIQKMYSVLENKYVDHEEEKSGSIDFQQIVKEASEKGSKRMVTMNSIQSKMQRRKCRKKREMLERYSLQMYNRDQPLEDFKENLKGSLKVQRASSKPIRTDYSQLQGVGPHHQQAKRQEWKMIAGKLSKNSIKTQQISSALQLSLLLREKKHSYSRRNVTLKQTCPTNRLSHRVYEATPRKANKALALKTQPSCPPAAALCKQTRTYWKKLLLNLRRVNQSFEY